MRIKRVLAKLKSPEGSKEKRNNFVDVKEEIRVFFYSTILKYILPHITETFNDTGRQIRSPRTGVFKVSLTYAFLPVLLILLKDYLVWQISLSIIFVVANSIQFWIYSYAINLQGKLFGGRHVIINPPSLGKTHIQLVVGGKKQIWKSDEIIFNPNKNLNPEGMPLTVEAMPDSGHYLRTPEERIQLFLEYEEMRRQGKKGIINKLADDRNLDRRTLQNYLDECRHITDLDEYLEKRNREKSEGKT